MMQVTRGWRGCRLAGWLGLLLLLPVLTGCGGDRGTVSGKVLYKGKGLPGGQLLFRPADARLNPVLVPLDAEGNYEVSLPPGDVQISIDNRDLEKSRGGGPPPVLPPGVKLPPGVRPEARQNRAAPEEAEKLPGRYVPIPKKYYSVDTSGLKYTVQKGSQEHNIDLK